MPKRKYKKIEEKNSGHKSTLNKEEIPVETQNNVSAHQTKIVHDAQKLIESDSHSSDYILDGMRPIKTKKKISTRMKDVLVHGGAQSPVSESLNLYSTTDVSSDDGSHDKRPILSCRFSDREFKKLILLSDIGKISTLLQRWICEGYTISRKQIPTSTLKKIFYSPTTVKEFHDDWELQDQFVKFISRSLINQARVSWLKEKIGDITFKNTCFRDFANTFNSEEKNIWKPIEGLDGNSQFIQNLFKCGSDVIDCLKPEDIEGLRHFALEQYEWKRKHTCDCCIQQYIKFDLSKHPDVYFQRLFKTNYPRIGLTFERGENETYKDYQRWTN